MSIPNDTYISNTTTMIASMISDKPTTITLPPYNVVSMSVLVSLLIIGVFGNSLIIYVFAYKKRRQIKRFEKFLLLLAVSDLMASLVIPMSFFYLTATDFKRWHFGETGCRIIPSLLQISITVSHGVLLLISYERYHSLVKPFNSRIGIFFIAGWLVAVVLLAVGLVSPYMMSLTVRQFGEYNIQTCMPDAQEKINLLMLSSTLQVVRDFLAIGTMGFLNQRMTHALTKQENYINWKRDKMSQKGRKLLRLVIIIFSSLTLPVDLFQLVFYSLVMANVNLLPAFEALSHINTFFNILQTSNSMVNIFIYSRMHDMFQLEWCKSHVIKTVRRKLTMNGRQLGTEVEYLTNKSNSSAEASVHSRNSSNF